MDVDAVALLIPTDYGSANLIKNQVVVDSNPTGLTENQLLMDFLIALLNYLH